MTKKKQNKKKYPKKDSLDKIYKVHDEDEYRQRLQSIITKKDYTSPTFWKKALKQRLFKAVAIIVRMELNNGNWRTFLQVIGKDNTFKYKGKCYIFDTEYRYFDLDLQMYCIDYHEGISLPIRRHIPVSDIKEDCRKLDSEVYNSLDPLTLQNLLEAKIAEGMMKGQAISEYLKRYGIMITIILFVVIIHLVLWAYRTGMFNQITQGVGL